MKKFWNLNNRGLNSQIITRRSMGRKSLIASAVAVLLVVGGLLYGPSLAGATQAINRPAISSVPLQIFAVSGDPASPGPGVRITPPTGDTVNGSQSTLVRTEDWLAVSIHTHNLPAGAYTFWWIIDEDGGGLSPANPRSIGVNAGGAIVGSDGMVNFDAVLHAGVIPERDWVTVLRNGDGTFDTTQTATVMVVVRYHGEVAADPDLVDLQISTFLAGCSNVAATGISPSADFVCWDPQRALHDPSDAVVSAVRDQSMQQADLPKTGGYAPTPRVLVLTSAVGLGLLGGGLLLKRRKGTRS